MKLPRRGPASGPDAAGYYRAHNRSSGAPCRDVSWHPHYPVLASTSFDNTVKVWTLQTQEHETEESKLSSEQHEENSHMHQYVSESGEDADEAGEEEESAGGMSINTILRFLMQRGHI